MSERTQTAGPGGNREGVAEGDSAVLRRLREKEAYLSGGNTVSAPATTTVSGNTSANYARDSVAPATGARRPAPPLLPRGFGTSAGSVR